jgi:hypothetical protein
VILFKNSRLGRSRSLRPPTVRDTLFLAALGTSVLAAGCWSQLDDLRPTGTSSSGDAGAADGGVCPSEDTCGGGNCPLCGLGEVCKYNSDCESRVCNGMCLPAGCGNKVRDEGESDVDCGGSCDPCKDGKRCEQDPHCQSNVCEDGFCQEATCKDETKNGTESDADCGGAGCEKCVDGKKCSGDDDCDSGFCGEGTCADPSCGDDAINGGETDLNCGGDCPDCVAGKQCETDDDCDSKKCLTDEDISVCAASLCDDELENGTESDEDCGGNDCDPCEEGKRCLVGTDCTSLVCEAVDDALTCIAATCSDERANGNETGEDCGGDTECDRCPAGEGCAAHADCTTNSCKDDICQEPTCEDGRQNQDEVGTDCGGDCNGCPAGTECSDPDDCRSGHCDTTCLLGGASTECDDAAECLSGSCQSNHCAAGSIDTECYENVDCLSNNCGSSQRCGPSGLGQACTADADCLSANCDTDAGECLESAYSIKTSLDSTPNQQITFEVWVERGASDPERVWGDFAMIYFFSPPPPANDAYDFVAKYYGNGPDREVRDSRFLAREVDDGEWAMIWRATSGNMTVIPTTPLASSIQFQLHSQPSLNFTDSGDFSYVAGSQVENPKVVVCQRVDGSWIHTQGQAPESASHPCELVIDACPSDGDLACDVLQRTD